MDMDGMNDAELTILSLLAEGDRYAHEIQSLIEERGMRAWVMIGFSSVYYVLNKLERQNMVSATDRRDEQGVARKYYHLTDAGRGILQTAVNDLLRQPRALGSGFELGLVNLNILKPQQVYTTLMHHRSDLRERLKYVETSLSNLKEHPTDPRHAMYTHSIALMRAELTWLDQFLADWKARYPAVQNAVDNENAESNSPSHSAPTQLSHHGEPKSAKQIQQMKRPKREE